MHMIGRGGWMRATTLSLIGALLGALALLAVPVAAQDDQAITIPGPASQSEREDPLPDPESGALILRAQEGSGARYAAVRLGTDMQVTVTGTIARVQVSQVFRNVSDDWVEGVYLYPLPDGAAVDTLKMTVGNRVIIGKIQTREDARITYETARAEGRRAGLVEQQRPNIFTNSVANIGPGETVLVVIEYQMAVEQRGAVFSLRLPLVVGPRYVPPQSLTSAAALADARAVTSAPIHDTALAAINPVSITVDLTPGFAPANIISAYHSVAVAGEGARRTITLAAGEVPQDRDFELSWISASATPTAALYRQELDGAQYVMVAITPPFPDENAFVPPREMVFVIDNSGSMGTDAMEAAKASLLGALASLRPEDHFNIIRFDDTMDQVFPASVPATPRNIAQAERFTRNLKADGGTVMLPALTAALTDTGVTSRADVVRQVIFLTDGAISNEEAMLAAIGGDAGNSRVFMVGIGSAPNTYLMNRMAREGRGTATIIGTIAEVAARMEQLIATLSRPAMQNLTAEVAGAQYEVTPAILPDLYAGEPLVLLARGDSLDGTITIAGRFGQSDWSRTLAFADADESPAIARLWARSRIDAIESDRVLRRTTLDEANAAIARLGLDFHIVTSQTSLVAVDETPARPDDTPLRREDLPINLPAGWDFDLLFGGDAARAALANAAAPPPSPAPPGEDAPIAVEEETDVAGYLSLAPVTVTSTAWLAQLIAGLLMALAGLAGLAWRNRRKENAHAPA